MADEAPDIQAQMPGFDPAMLQQILAQGAGPAMPPNASGFQNMGPAAPPPASPFATSGPVVPSSTTPAAANAAPAGGSPAIAPPMPGADAPINLGSADRPAQQQTPKQSAMPALAGFLQQMIKGPGYEPGAPGQPARPISRLDAFENFLGNFLNSFSSGMSNAGTGPAANARGFGSAVQAPYQRQMQQYQMGQQQQAQQAAVGLQQAETQQKEAQTAQMGQMITLPNGVQMPLSLAQKVYPAMVSGQAKVAAAGVQKRFMTTPFGVYDTQTQKYAGGTSGAGPTALTTINQEMADQYGLPKDLVGKQVKLTDLAALERGAASQITPVQGSEGPALANKVTKEVTKLGLGSPAANQIAQGKLSLAQQQFERDTFGTLFGKNIPSSLVDDMGGTIGWKSPSAPTANIKTTGQQAQATLKVIDEAERQLAQANKAGKLGPAAGRINEWMVGKVGADDPQFAAVRAITSLAMTGTLKAHFGSRAPVQMFEHFNDLANSGKMTYGDLTAALKSFRFVLNDYANQARSAGSASGGSSDKVDALTKKYGGTTP